MTEEDMRVLAEKNENIKQQLDAIDGASAVRAPKSIASTLAGIAGGAAASATAGSLLGPIGTIGGLAIGAAGAIAGSGAAGMVIGQIDSADALSHTAVGEIKRLREKIDSGQMMTTSDVYRLFVASKPELQDAIRQAIGSDFPTKDEAQMTPNELKQMNDALGVNARLRDAATTFATQINNRWLAPETLISSSEMVDAILGNRQIVIAGGTTEKTIAPQGTTSVATPQLPQSATPDNNGDDDSPETTAPKRNHVDKLLAERAFTKGEYGNSLPA